MGKTARIQMRKLRHWKQRFHKNAEFIFRRRLTWGGRVYEPGDPIPKELGDSPTKLRRFWESHTVELAEFEEPNVATGQVVEQELPEGVTVEKGNGSWFIVTAPDGKHRVNGKRALTQVLEQLSEVDDTDPSLVGSSVLKGEYDIESETVTLGEIVAITFDDSGLTEAEWNDMDNAAREELLAQSLSWMQYQGEDEPEQSGGDGDETPGTSEDGAEASGETDTETTDDDFLS